MSVWIGRIYIVNGIRTEVRAEGGSAKEALSYVEQHGAELGGVVEASPSAARPVVAVGATAAAPVPAEGRKRRTKAEIEADNAREAAAAQPPALPSTAAAPSDTVPPGVTQAFGPAVALSPAPPVLPGPSEVTISAPPFAAAPPMFTPPPVVEAPPSPERVAQHEVTLALESLYAAVPDAWAPSVKQQVESILQPIAGGNVDLMSLGESQAALHGIRAYHEKCIQALRG